MLLFVCINLLSLYMLSACDICSCGSASNDGYGGTMPRIGRGFAGLRGYASNFHTLQSLSSANQFSKESFQSMEVFGRFYPMKRLQIMAFVPYKISTQSYNNKVNTIHGIGDASLYAHYIVFNTADSLMLKWKQTFSVGVGLKLPTGNAQMPTEKVDLAPNLLSGTGSWDKIINANYNLRTARWGMSIDASYRFNGTNKNEVHFGNRASVSMRAFYAKAIKNSMLLPQIGIVHEYAALDKLAKMKQSHTGGNATFLHTGLDFYANKFAYGLVYQLPIYQNLAKGYITAQSRMTAQILFFF